MASLVLQFHPFLSVPTKRTLPHAKFFFPLSLRAEAGKVKTEQTVLKSSAFLRRPVVEEPSLQEREAEEAEEEEEQEEEEIEEEKEEEEVVRQSDVRGRRGRKQELVQWEDMILEDTVPLVGFVRMILHSGKYDNDDRLTPEHETAILDKLLPFHPEYEKKIGCGVDYIKVGLHPQFDESRCLFIVRKDGEVEDFSFWKCIKGLIKKKYPLYADYFMHKHFHKKRD
ncbi:hypothetical protein LUZ63_008267 [Rhynchospora breviuscula]|uniref:Uncharacterized protein n=1 Tax=Rhynchospora breviuscula TaxID=2022672 RepID=A0A9Q0CTU6_9POAL|nr:hypothetical protein LUZ63_008267 [Rhynchospora breviuscula]